MKSLGNRLNAVSECIHASGPFSRLADIGSDHAFIAIRAMQNNDAGAAVASDIHEGPLQRGRDNAHTAGVSVDFVLSDGFENLRDYQFDCVCICGMGGETIAEILRLGGAQVSKENCTLILQPMTAHDDLRKYLWDNGFSIRQEVYVAEHGKPYVILIADYSGIPIPYSYADLFIGKERPQTEMFVSYAKKALSQALKRKKGLGSDAERMEAEDKLISEISNLMQA